MEEEEEEEEEDEEEEDDEEEDTEDDSQSDEEEESEEEVSQHRFSHGKCPINHTWETLSFKTEFSFFLYFKIQKS